MQMYILAILSVKLIYNVSELYLKAQVVLQTNNDFSKVDLENIRNKISVIRF